jgi:hypothetical protein
MILVDGKFTFELFDGELSDPLAAPSTRNSLHFDVETKSIEL